MYGSNSNVELWNYTYIYIYILSCAEMHPKWAYCHVTTPTRSVFSWPYEWVAGVITPMNVAIFEELWTLSCWVQISWWTNPYVPGFWRSTKAHPWGQFEAPRERLDGFFQWSKNPNKVPLLLYFCFILVPRMMIMIYNLYIYNSHMNFCYSLAPLILKLYWINMADLDKCKAPYTGC